MAAGSDFDKYRFPSTLSEQSRIIGLPYDEFIPAVLAMLWGIFTRKYLFGLILALIVWQLIKAAKRGKSSKWLYNWCYWYLPTELFRVVYRVIPDSSYRKWLK
ncbi:type IV conjugative transfer system protein TraL [Klebsiella aerogenes]|uniref:type IV conjugative transfer system protein TraL n=1 Tax=Klebsiella aerogenes TaxID=548 RepID=UPI002E3406E5|nr:type IV conjugative transfer system protein TraL [Klebsiella aerogenes]MED7793154.1 type IV conjugative transfer system protein TraL [Klebsiella aerogenes]